MMNKQGQFLKAGPGLYRSTDGAEHWKLITQSRPLLWPKDFTIDPSDSNIVYVGACDARADQAGLWRTTDGGKHWTRLAKRGSEHFGAYLNPVHKGWIYMTLTEGPARCRPLAEQGRRPDLEGHEFAVRERPARALRPGQ